MPLSNGFARALIKIDLSALPPGTEVLYAVLRLHANLRCTSACGNPSWMEPKRITGSWSESTTTGASMPSTHFDSEGLEQVNLWNHDWEMHVRIPVSMVQGWIDNPSTNRGLSFMGTPEIWSSEAADPELRPELVLLLK